MEILKRLMAALQALVMVFTMLPLPALAEETEPVTVPEETAPAGEVALDIPETIETEVLETVPETTIPEETWEVAEIALEETAAAVNAKEAATSGSCGENVTWELVNGVLTIRGEGAMEDYYQYGTPWEHNRNAITTIIIEDGVTTIGEWAFSLCWSLTKADIPDSVVSINRFGFYSCRKLESITIPDSVHTIGENAFDECFSLNSVKLSANITVIEEETFHDCDSLTAVIIPDGVTEIGKNAFSYSGLQSVTFSDSITKISEYAFTDCYNLSAITIPYSVTEIGECVFRNCRKLVSATIFGNLSTIPDSTFSACGSLTSVILPDSITEIGVSAFWDCESLCSIAIPEGVTVIDDSAFSSCENLTDIKLPDSLTILGESVFDFCEGLTSITIPYGVTSLEAGVFAYCRNLVNVVLPDGLAVIGWGAFSGCTSLTSVELPYGVTYIDGRAFDDCTNLVTVTIPDTVTYIGGRAFEDCTNLTNVNIPYGVTEIDAYTFYKCASLTDVVIPDTVTKIGKEAFYRCENLTSVVMSENLTTIEESAFALCKKLLSISLPDWVTDIGKRAFYGCASLSYIRIPERVTIIDDYTFYGCSNLSSVVIPDRVWCVGYYAFNNCSNLQSISDLGRVEVIGQSAFSGCKKLTSITLGDTIQGIHNGAFGGCDNLTDLYYAGSESDWEKVDIHANINSQNEYFFNRVTIHYNSPVSVKDYYQLKLKPNEGLATFPEGTAIQFTCSLLRNGEVVSNWEKPTVTFWDGSNIVEEEWEKVDSDWILTLKGLKTGTEKIEITENYSGDRYKFSIEVTPSPVKEYLDNSFIRINGSGSAYAYYQGDPNTTYHYTLNGGSALTVKSNDKGILRIPLGTFKAGGTYENSVQFTKIGNTALESSIGFKPTVIATQLEYSHEFQVSLDTSVGVEIGEGVGVKLGTFKSKATLGQLGTGAGLGGAITITDTYADGSRTLEVMDQTAVDAYGSFDSGISGETQTVKVDILSSSTKIKATGTGIYGLRIRNYSEENQNAQKAIATFFLGEALKEKSNNVYLRDFQNWLAEKLYTQSTVDVIDGRGAAVSGEFEAGGANLTIGNLPLITGLKSDLEATASISEKSYGNGDSEFSTSITADVDMDLASLNMFNGVVGADYLGKDITVKVAKETGKKSLETTSLSSEVMEAANIVKGEHFTADYNQFVFEEDSLDELMQNAKSVDDYINGNRIAANNADMEDIATVLSGSEVPVEYANLEKSHFLTTNPLEFGVTIGVGVDFGLTASYMQSVEHQKAGGFVKEDEILINSESKDYSAEMDKKLLTLDEWLAQPFVSLVEEVKEFFEKIAGTIQEGIETAWGWIEGKADSLSDWMVSLMAASNEDAWASSQEIGIKGDQVNFALARQISNANEAYATRSATTIGRPFVVNVTDSATGEQIKDFSTESLTFTIRYAGEDLMAANYNAETQVISMYRYSDDGDYFEYIGGIHDADAMTVTSTITKPGQYILAAEAIPEEEPGEDTHEGKLGDVNHDGKINAKDATLILQKSVGVLKPTAKFCEDCAEVSGDGKLNAKDSTLILQFSVGLRETFPAEQ